MDESTYQKLAETTLREIETLLDDVDAEDVDIERAGDVLTLTFKNKKKCVINTQRPTRQIWLAADARAWHFAWDAASRRWLDDKGQGIELVDRVRAIVREQSGVTI